MVEKHWKTAGVVSLIAFLCYINSLEGDFVYDDSRAIVQNMDILPSTPWSNLVFNDFWGTPLKHSGSHRSYRPVCVASFRLNYYISALNPWGYHLVNILLHCAVCVMVVFVANVVFKENITVSVAGVLFAVHPVHTEAVSGLVGRADVGAGLFYLASWLSYHHGCPNHIITTRWSWVLLSMVFAALSMLTKEQGVTVIGVCLLYDVIVISRIRMKDFHLTLKKAKENGLFQRIILLFSTASFLLATRMILMNNSPPSFSKSDNPAANSDSFVTRTLTFLYLPAMNFWLLVFPHTLCFDWSMTSIPLVESLNDVRNLFSFVFYISFVLFITLCLKGVLRQESKSEFAIKTPSKNFKNNIKMFGLRNRRILQKANGNVGHSHVNNNVPSNEVKSGRKVNKTEDIVETNSIKTSHYILLDKNERALLSLAFLVLPFIPATNLFFYVGFVIAERVLYLPSIGFCLLFAHCFSIFWKSCGRFLRIFLAVMTCMYFVLLSARTVRRNIDWRSDENLYRSGIAVNPSKAWSNLGNVLKEQGKMTEAEKAYKESIDHKWSADTWYNLGLLYHEQKRFNESVKCYEQAIELRPRFVLPYLNLGVVMENLKNKEKALDILTQATQLNGEGLKNPKQHKRGVAAAKYHRGRILADLKRFDEAIEVYREAVETRPDNFAPQSLYNLLGEALFAKGEIQEAELWYRRSLESKPDHLPAFLTLAKLLSSSPGRVDEAEDLYKKAFELKRDNADIFIHYSRHLAAHGKANSAAKIMKEAVTKFPKNVNILAISADAHRKIKDYHLAQQYYEKAAELNPMSLSAQMNLGAMYHLVLKFDLAQKYYLKALELAPDDKSTLDNLRKLRNTMKQRQKSHD